MAWRCGARAQRWLLFASVLACEEFEDTPEPTCDDRFGTFFYPGFEAGPAEFESCEPCVVRGGTFEIEFVAEPVVEGDVRVIAGSPDYFTELGEGVLRAERAGQASVMAWAEDRVIAIATLFIRDFDDLALFDGSIEVSSLELEVEDVQHLEVQPVFDPGFECELVGALEVEATSSDAAVIEVTTEGAFLRVHAIGRGEATVRIEVAGFTRELEVLVGVPQHDSAAEESSSG